MRRFLTHFHFEMWFFAAQFFSFSRGVLNFFIFVRLEVILEVKEKVEKSLLEIFKNERLSNVLKKDH